MLVARASLSDAEHRVSRLNVWCCTFVRVVNRDARFVEHRVGSRQLRVSRKDPFFNARPLAKTSLRPPLIAAAASWALAQQN